MTIIAEKGKAGRQIGILPTACSLKSHTILTCKYIANHSLSLDLNHGSPSPAPPLEQTNFKSIIITGLSCIIHKIIHSLWSYSCHHLCFRFCSVPLKGQADYMEFFLHYYGFNLLILLIMQTVICNCGNERHEIFTPMVTHFLQLSHCVFKICPKTQSHFIWVLMNGANSQCM